MADIAKKTVSIYIDQASAELALEKLQQKADGFSKKAEEARKRQQELNAEIERSKAAAAGLDGLRQQYSELEKGISKTGRALDVTTASQKKLQAENKSLSATLEAATTKQNELLASIEKGKASGDATKRLENSYETLSKSIQETTEKLRLNEAASAAAASKQQVLTTQLQAQKTAAAALNTEVRQAASAAASVSRLTAEEAKLQKQLTSTEQALEKNLAAQKEIQHQVDAGLRPSFNQLTSLVQKLEKELKNLSEDAPGYASKFAAFKSASAELEGMRTRISGVKQESEGLMSQFKGVAFGVVAGGMVQNALAAIPQWISNTINAGGKLSDELADVEKATGLTTEEVRQLNSELGKIDTRTKVSQLRAIAIGLGQINQEASKQNIAAIDKIVVALGDEFGGDANEITKVLSILRNNLQDIKTGDYAKDVEHIGNALNVLGAEGLATAPVVTDIANRIAGISQQFKISSGDILGFAATFQELGIETERGSTAIVKLFQQIGAEPEKFAKVAGLPLKEFTDLVNNDMTAAFLKVAKGAQQAGNTNVAFSKILKDLDADGSGAGEVLSKLAANSDLLAQKQKRAGEALKESSSITEEFTKKNTTLGAEIEKLGKRFNSFFSNTALNNFIKGAVAQLNDLFEKTKDVNEVLEDQRSSFNHLEKDVVPVINRYEELKKKAVELGGESKLSKTEQEELKKAIQAIGETIPSAITQFDAYGNAISISTERAREYIELHKLMLQDANRDAIAAQEARIRGLEEEKKGYDSQFATAKKLLDRQQSLAEQARKGGYLTDNTLEILNTYERGYNSLLLTVNKYAKEIKGAQANLKSLKGEDLFGEEKKDPHNHEDTGGFITPEEAKRREQAAKQNQVKTEEQLQAEAESRKKYLADLKQHNKELHEEELRREEEWQKQFAEASAFMLKWKQLRAEQLKEYPEVQAKLDEFVNDNSYATQLAKIKAFYDRKRQIFQNDATALKQLQQAEAAETASLVSTLVSRSVEEASRQTIQRLKDLPETTREERRQKDLVQVQIGLLTAQGRERLELQKRQAVDEHDEAIAALKRQLKDKQLTQEQFDNQMLLLNAQFNQQIDELNTNFQLEQLNKVLDYAQQALNAFNSITDAVNSNEDAQLNKDKKANDAKRKNYENLLKSKAISQSEYNRRIAELDAEDDARQEAVRKKQFERGKKLQLLQVAISTAQAVMSTLAAVPGPLDIATLGGARIAQIAFAVALGGVQAAAIASKKYAKGGISQGPSHAEGGIAMIDRRTGQEVGEMEGQEAILSRKTVRNNPELVGQLLHASMHADGARVQLPWQNRSYQGINYSSVGNALRTVRRYENGGFVSTSTASPVVAANTEVQQQNIAVNAAMLDTLDALRRQMATPQRNYVLLQDINNNQAIMDRIVTNATASRS